MPIFKSAQTASACGTPTADFSASHNNGCSTETATIQEYKKLVRFLIITMIIAFSILQPAFGMSGAWPRCVGTYKANDISGPNAKFTIISHSKDRQEFLSLKLDINSLHKECKGSMLPGFEIGEFS
jgi:hypothetical protein